MIRNPLTGKSIKIRGRLHTTLVNKGVLPQESLNYNTTAIIEHKRKRRVICVIEYHAKHTHLLNLQEICDQLSYMDEISDLNLKITPWDIVLFLQSEGFDSIKMCLYKKRLTVIFSGVEPFIEDAINDYVKEKLPNVNYNL